ERAKIACGAADPLRERYCAGAIRRAGQGSSRSHCRKLRTKSARRRRSGGAASGRRPDRPGRNDLLRLKDQAAGHDRGGPKSRLFVSAFAKAALGVKGRGARIGGDDQHRGFKREGELRRLLDEAPADAPAPQIRLDEEAVEFSIAIL